MAEGDGNVLPLKYASSSLMDFVNRLGNTAIEEVVSSVTYIPDNRTIVIQLRNLLGREADVIDVTRTGLDEDTVRKVNRITELSEKYKKQYPRLVRHFKKWKTTREEVIEQSSTGAEELDRNYKNAVLMRLVGSSVEMAGTLAEVVLRQHGFTYWSQLAFNTATCFGFLGLFYTASEVLRSKQIHRKVSKAVDNDKEEFKLVQEWFEQTDELKTAVKSIFPYGIDEDIVKEIEKSASDADECLKIFTSALVTNVREDTKLSSERGFLETVRVFATSEAAKDWWNRIILEQNPLYVEAYKALLNSDIPAIKELGSCAESFLPVESTKLIALQTQVKLLLCSLSIYTAYNDLMDGAKCKHSERLRRFGKKNKKELDALDNVVQHLKPKTL